MGGGCEEGEKAELHTGAVCFVANLCVVGVRDIPLHVCRC